MKGSKKILIIGGPNGAGKTTFAMEFLPNEAHCPIFINADLIAAGLNPFRPDLAAIQAGRLMLKMILDCVEKEESFAFETTLSGRNYTRLIPLWQKKGYLIKLLFLRLPTPEMAIARVRQRVLEGGHDVPEQTVRRRFHSRLRNFQLFYKNMADDWAVYDSSEGIPMLIDKKSQDQHLTGAEAAMLRAAKKACRKAIETTGSVAIFTDGEIIREKDIRKIFPDDAVSNSS